MKLIFIVCILVGLFVFVFVVLLLIQCSKVLVGNVGVKFKFYGDGKGLLQELQLGCYWVGWGYDLYIFFIFIQNYIWICSVIEGLLNDELLIFQIVEGLLVNVDVGIIYYINLDKVIMIFQKYCKGVNEIIDIYLCNMVCDLLVKELSVLGIELVYGCGKVLLIQFVQDDVSQQVGLIGIVIEKIYWIGELCLLVMVVQLINVKIQVMQMVEQCKNEIVQVQVEVVKEVVMVEGKVKVQLVIVEVEVQVICMKGDVLCVNLDIIYMIVVEKWNGQLFKYIGGSLVLLIQLLEVK